MIIIRAMDPYELLWMVLLIVFVLGELATIGLTCIWVCRRCTCGTGYGNGRGKSGGAVSGIFRGIHSFACCRQDRGRVNM